jgi:hypothetical protein
MPDTITELEKLPLNVVESLLKYCAKCYKCYRENLNCFKIPSFMFQVLII